MLKCVCMRNIGAWAESKDGEVLFVRDDRIEVQGTVVFSVARNGAVEKITVDFTENSVQTIEL